MLANFTFTISVDTSRFYCEGNIFVWKLCIYCGLGFSFRDRWVWQGSLGP